MNKHDKSNKPEKVIFVSGHFNVIHPGHLRLIRFAKECGQKLIIGVQSDRLAGFAAHVPEHLRLEGVQSNNWVDHAFIIDEPITDVIMKLRPDIVVKGKEHEFRFNPELDALLKYGGQLFFCSGETIFSSFDLIRREFEQTDSFSDTLPLEYMERHAINSSSVNAIIDGFSKLKVCVVGDLIVDEYITCQPLGMSQEDPTIVVTPLDTERFIGGAGIVAAHAAGMGASVRYFSVTGKDDSRSFAINKLANYGVNISLFLDESRPTTLKQRYRSHGKTLLRVSHLHQAPISSELQSQIIEKLESAIKDSDLLVFSDFNYGCLPQPLVDHVTAFARRYDVILAADSQSSSQVGDIGRFKYMDLITPTEREARLSTRNQEDGLVILSDMLKEQSKTKNILLKLGAEGLLVHSTIMNSEEWHTDRIRALNLAPKDVSGAGDSLLIASAMTLALGGTIWEAALLGSISASIQVGRVGNTPIRSKEMYAQLSKLTVNEPEHKK